MMNQLTSDTMDVRNLACAIGNILERNYPAVKPGDHDRAIAVPHAHVPAIADAITLVVADILQSWLDAGSERDVTLEELGPVIEGHVYGWAYPTPTPTPKEFHSNDPTHP